MLDEHVPFFERTFVEQELDALAGRELALGVLGLDALCSAALTGVLALFLQRIDDVFHGPPSDSVCWQIHGPNARRQAEPRPQAVNYRPALVLDPDAKGHVRRFAGEI